MQVPEANRLTREAAGLYRTADGRFEVRSDAGRWFLVDTEQANELGQELIRGPYATREEASLAIAAARSKRVKAPPRPKASPPAKGSPKPKAKAAPKPQSWIDRLPAAEATRARSLVRALEREGIAGAEALVRRDREGMAPAIVQRLIERELAALTADLPPAERKAAERLVRRTASIVAGQGVKRARGLPGWQLVEIGPEPDPPNRRISLPD